MATAGTALLRISPEVGGRRLQRIVLWLWIGMIVLGMAAEGRQ